MPNRNKKFGKDKSKQISEQDLIIKKRRKRRIMNTLFITFIVFLIGFFSFVGYTVYTISQAPSISQSKLESKESTRIYDKDGNEIYRSSFQNRDYVKYSDLPDNYKNALISTEDKTFWKNSGVDWAQTAKATAGTVIHRGTGTTAGGSTITQQLIKLSIFSTSAKDRTIKRKIQEIWLAYQVNKKFSKQQILEMYVNRLYMGNNVYGAQTAAKYYYNKPLKDLDLAQSAIIAGMGQSPSVYNLFTNPDAVQQRKREVLISMMNNGKITRDEARKAINEDVTSGLVKQEETLKFASDKVKVDQAYIQGVLDQVQANGYDPYTDHLKIYTNLDQAKQQSVYDTLNNSSAFNQITHNKDDFQAAATAVNPNNGAVIAQVGGRNLKTLFGLNRANQLARSTGSAIKPLIDYAPAIEYLNWGTNTLIQDTPYTYAGTSINLYDWDKRFMGPITMRYALEQSRNVTAARTLDAVGGSRATNFLNRLGFQLNKTVGGSDAIGIDSSTIRMAGAYAAVANDGYYTRPSYVNYLVDGNGNKRNLMSSPTKAMKSSTAFILQSMMQGTLKQGATATHANVDGLTQAVKTGLVAYEDGANVPASAIKDSWTSGFTKPDKNTNSGISLSIWTGYDQPLEQGHYIDWNNQSIPEELYSQIMSQITKGQKNGTWDRPATVQLSGGSDSDQKNAIYVPNDDSAKPQTKSSVDGSSQLVSIWGVNGQPANSNNNNASGQNNGQTQGQQNQDKQVQVSGGDNNNGN